MVVFLFLPFFWIDHSFRLGDCRCETSRNIKYPRFGSTFAPWLFVCVSFFAFFCLFVYRSCRSKPHAEQRSRCSVPLLLLNANSSTTLTSSGPPTTSGMIAFLSWNEACRRMVLPATGRTIISQLSLVYAKGHRIRIKTRSTAMHALGVRAHILCSTAPGHSSVLNHRPSHRHRTERHHRLTHPIRENSNSQAPTILPPRPRINTPPPTPYGG